MKTIIISLLVFLATTSSAAPIPGKYSSCVEGAEVNKICALTLTEDGFLIDHSRHEKIFTIPEATGVIEGNWLHVNDGNYILEKSNYSSSKSKTWIFFRFDKRVISVDRVYGFSQELDMQTGPIWLGYECRNISVINNDKSKLPMSDLAVNVVCGEVSRNAGTPESSTPSTVSKVSDLMLEIPVYGPNSKGVTATYVFPGSDEPDVLNMTCKKIAH